MADPDYDEDGDFLTKEEMMKEDDLYHLYGSLGFFTTAYSKVELALTALLAELLQNRDFEAFHTITRGLDGPAKATRIKELAERMGIYDHKNAFGQRLILFKESIGGFRNRISHSFINLAADAPILGFYDISYISEEPKPVKYVASQEMIDLQEEWLDNFFDDVLPVLRLARTRSMLTITHPRSMEPQAFRHTLQKLETAAKRLTRPKKRL